MTKIFCAMPTRGKMHVLAREAFGAASDFPDVLVHGECVIAWHVVAARNHCVRLFLRSDADYLVMVDDDVVIPQNAIEAMLEASAVLDASLVSALVPFIHDGELRVSVGIEPEGYLRPWPRGNFLIDQCGGACVLIRRDVFDKVLFPWFNWFEERVNGDQLGEDVEFAKRVREASLRIAAVDVRCHHLVDEVDLYNFADRVDLGETRAVSRLGVISCPRSGTAYFVEYAKSCGLRLGHETIEEDGGVGWWFAARHAVSPWHKRGIAGRRFSRLIHLVREPTACIGSLIALLKNPDRRWLDYVRRFVRIAPGLGDSVADATEIWLAWQRLCLSQDCDGIMQVEHPEKLDAAMARWNWPVADCKRPAASDGINATPGKREWTAAAIASSLAEPMLLELLEIGELLGYPMKEFALCEST